MKYIAKTHVAITVNKGGANVHITFVPRTGGGSVFYTDDAGLAAALESHNKYGKLFKKAEEPKPVVKKVEKSSVSEAPAAKKAMEKKFNDYEDAKDWIIESYGISRTKLRSKVAIEDAFKAKGIKLIID